MLFDQHTSMSPDSPLTLKPEHLAGDKEERFLTGSKAASNILRLFHEIRPGTLEKTNHEMAENVGVARFFQAISWNLSPDDTHKDDIAGSSLTRIFKECIRWMYKNHNTQLPYFFLLFSDVLLVGDEAMGIAPASFDLYLRLLVEVDPSIRKSFEAITSVIHPYFQPALDSAIVTLPQSSSRQSSAMGKWFDCARRALQSLRRISCTCSDV